MFTLPKNVEAAAIKKTEAWAGLQEENPLSLRSPSFGRVSPEEVVISRRESLEQKQFCVSSQLCEGGEGSSSDQ